MIQRIQTVYLMLGIAALGALCFMGPVWQAEPVLTSLWPAAEAYQPQVQAGFTPAVLGLAGLAALLALVAIFRYKRRVQQRSLVGGVQVLTVLLTAVLYGGLYLAGALGRVQQSFRSVQAGAWDVEYELLAALLLPILTYLFFFLARRGIERDIKLVRSMDRLRG